MPDNFVSIDIGSFSTKIIEGELKKGVIEICHIKAFDSPYKNDELDVNLFFDNLFKIVPLNRLKSSEVSILIPATAIAFSVMDLPRMPKEDMGKAVIREAKRKILPAPKPEDILEFIVAGERKIQNIAQMHVLAGAGERAIVSKYLDYFTSVGVTPSYIGSTPLGLMAYFNEFKIPVQDNWAIIDVGYRNSNLSIFSKNDIILIRNIHFALYDFITALSKKDSISFNDASQRLLTGVAKMEMLNDSWQYLLSELRRSFAYFKELTSDQRIDSIMLSGGMFQLPGAFEFLKKNIGGNLTLALLNNSRNVSFKNISPEQLGLAGSAYTSCIGLLLNLKRSKIPVLNFLPPEIRHEKKIREIKVLSSQLLAVIAVVLGLTFFIFLSRMYALNISLNQQKNKFSESEFNTLSKNYSEISKLLDGLKKQKEIEAKVGKIRFAWAGLFRILGDSLPPNAYISEINAGYENEKEKPEAKKSKDKFIYISVKGIVISDYEHAREDLSRMEKRLNDSGRFSEVELVPMKFESITIKGADHDEQGLTQSSPREFQVQAKAKLK